MSDVVRIAKELADEFRPGAAEGDRTGAFPAENYARMRETGYLRAIVPEELGGLGATLGEMALAQQALARGCASTALAVNMHQFQVGTSVDAFRSMGVGEPVLRRIADEGVVIASTGAEAIVAGEWTPGTTAERRNGDYVINGRRFFCSQAPGMDMLRIIARDTETDEVLVVGMPGKAEGITVLDTWDTQGMRATASHDVLLENVKVPESAVGARLPAGPPLRNPPLANVARWFVPLMSSVYIGIAEEARDEAYKAIGTGVNSASRHPVLTDVLIGEMEAALLTAVSVRDTVVARATAEGASPMGVLPDVVLCKDIVTAKALEAVDKAVEIAGGRSFYRKSPLERLSRDVRAGRFHPPSAPMSFQIAGERLREARAAAPATA